MKSLSQERVLAKTKYKENQMGLLELNKHNNQNKNLREPCVVVGVRTPSTWEAEVGGLLEVKNSRPIWVIQ